MTEMQHSWQDVAIAFVAALPAICAALIGVRNGRKIDRHDAWERNGKPPEKGDAKKVKTRPKKNGQHPDWYRPLDL